MAIKIFYLNGFLFTASLVVIGCSSSGDSVSETPEQEYVTETTQAKPVSAPVDTTRKRGTPITSKTSPQRFNVQADTLSVHSRKKTSNSKTDISVRAAAPSHYYSVQIGAFRLKSNADRNYTLTQKRFNLPTIRVYESGINMERICAGKFSTKKQATDFLKKIQEQYPKDYTDAWVAMFKK